MNNFCCFVAQSELKVPGIMSLFNIVFMMLYLYCKSVVISSSIYFNQVFTELSVMKCDKGSTRVVRKFAVWCSLPE
jgi:hypothetical protein